MAKNGKRLGILPGWRKGTYIILLFNLLMLIWVITGIASANGSPTDCGTLDVDTCNAAQDAGAAIGVGLIIGLWVVGDIILGILWLVTNRKKSRECPACGTDVRKGQFACASCGYDFRSALAGTPPYGSTSAPTGDVTRERQP